MRVRARGQRAKGYTDRTVAEKSLTDLVLALLVLDPLQDVVHDAGARSVVEEGVLVVDDETVRGEQAEAGSEGLKLHCVGLPVGGPP